MKLSFTLISLSLLLSGSALAKDDTESTIGFSNSGGTAIIFDVADKKYGSTLGMRGTVPLSNTARSVQSMNERWHHKLNDGKSNIELYGTIEIGYSHTSH